MLKFWRGLQWFSQDDDGWFVVLTMFWMQWQYFQYILEGNTGIQLLDWSIQGIVYQATWRIRLYLLHSHILYYNANKYPYIRVTLTQFSVVLNRFWYHSPPGYLVVGTILVQNAQGRVDRVVQIKLTSAIFALWLPVAGCFVSRSLGSENWTVCWVILDRANIGLRLVGPTHSMSKSLLSICIWSCRLVILWIGYDLVNFTIISLTYQMQNGFAVFVLRAE